VDLFATALATLRAVHMTAMLSLAGALSFRLLVAPYPLARVLRPSAVLAILGGLVWLVLQSAALSGADTIPDTLAAIGTVIRDTRFGNVLMLRLVLLVVVAALAWRSERPLLTVPAALLAAVAVILQAALGHAAASGNPVLEASLGVHLLAASAWLGGLLPLWLALRTPLNQTAHATVARNFSLVGIVAVFAIAATAFEQGAALFGGFAGLIGTAYGHTALIKIALFLLLLLLASANRLVLTPALEQSRIAASGCGCLFWPRSCSGRWSCWRPPTSPHCRPVCTRSRSGPSRCS
jgi:putative copper resistance protein D